MSPGPARAPAGDGAAQQPAQHVARAFVARQRPFGDRERQRAHVVGDDARVAHGRLRVGDLLRVAQHRVHERREQVGLEDRVLALQDEREALDAHARVDARVREQVDLPSGCASNCGNTRFQELHEAVAGVARGLAPEGAVGQVVGTLLAEVEVDLGARAARAGAPAGPQKLSLRPSATR